MIKHLLMITVMIMLTGCGEDKYIPVPKYIKVLPSKSMVTQVHIPSPPSPDLYVTMSGIDKEKALTRYNVKLLTALGRADVKLKAVDQWRNEELNQTINGDSNDNKDIKTRNTNSFFNWL